MSRYKVNRRFLSEAAPLLRETVASRGLPRIDFPARSILTKLAWFTMILIRELDNLNDGLLQRATPSNKIKKLVSNSGCKVAIALRYNMPVYPLFKQE